MIAIMAWFYSIEPRKNALFRWKKLVKIFVLVGILSTCRVLLPAEAKFVPPSDVSMPSGPIVPTGTRYTS